MNKFKIGDRVRLTANHSDLFKKGEEGIIDRMDSTDLPYGIKMDIGSCIWETENCIELVTDNPQDESNALTALKELVEKSKRVDELEALVAELRAKAETKKLPRKDECIRDETLKPIIASIKHAIKSNYREDSILHLMSLERIDTDDEFFYAYRILVGEFEKGE